MSKVYCGDNLEIMASMPDDHFDLIYLDPPFFSQRNYEVIWGDAEEVRSFKDRWDGGIYEYISWMKERLSECHRILKPTGSIYLHCDHHASHYLKVMLDEIFGVKNFRNEIIWNYGNSATLRKVGFPQKHDTILFYTKSNSYIFNPQYKPYANPKMPFYRNEDEHGKYALVKRKKSDGTIYYGKSYANKKGVPETDVWDIKILNSQAKERLGYPTQKPEKLLERIIKASSNEGDNVLDPFCGCGTTGAVCKNLNRNFTGIDVSPKAVEIIKTRIGCETINGIGIEKWAPHEFQQWVCDKMIAKNTSPDPLKASGADGGVDGVVLKGLNTGKAGGSPIQVKQSKKVGVAVVKQLYATMSEDYPNKRGFIVALSFGSGAIEKAAKLKVKGLADITLITADDLLKVPYYIY